VPTLVIHGKADQMLSPINGDLIASLIAGARLELFDDVGHLVCCEQPELVAALVRERAGAQV